jgi:threonine/homoserine/homoserine lactone efflux protein
MFVALIAGIIIGIVMGIPPGPVAVTVIKLGLNKGLKHSVSASLGTGVMDFFYCLISMFAASAIISLVNNFFKLYPIIVLIFQILVIVSVIIFGIIQFRIKDKIINTDPEIISKRNKFLDNLSHKGPFLLGIAVALANVASPTFLPSIAYVTMNVHSFGIIENKAVNNVIFSLGFGFGNFLWLYVIIKAILHYRERMSPRFLARIHQFAGFTLIGFGTILGFRVLVHWAEVLRFALAF